MQPFAIILYVSKQTVREQLARRAAHIRLSTALHRPFALLRSW